MLYNASFDSKLKNLQKVPSVQRYTLYYFLMQYILRRHQIFNRYFTEDINKC